MANQNYPMQGYNNNGYQAPYPNQNMNMPSPVPTQMPMTNRGIASIAEVVGEDGMNSYPVAAGTTALLIDFNLGTFWLKSRDVYGVPRETRRFNFSELVPQPQQVGQPVQPQAMPQTQMAPDVQNQNDGVSREEFNEIRDTLTKLYKELHE